MSSVSGKVVVGEEEEEEEVVVPKKVKENKQVHYDLIYKRLRPNLKQQVLQLLGQTLQDQS